MPRPCARVRPHAGGGRCSRCAAGRASRRSPWRAPAASGRSGSAGSRRAAGDGPSVGGRRPRTDRALTAYVRLQARRQAWAILRDRRRERGRGWAPAARHCEDSTREMPSSESCRLSARPRFGTGLADSARPTTCERSPSRVHIRRGRRESLRPLGLQHDRAARALWPRGSKAPRRMAWRLGELRLKCRRIQCFGLGTGGSPTGFEPVFQP